MEMDIGEINELMLREEALDPELEPHLCRGPFGPALKHPLIIEIFFDPKRCGLINKRYALLKQRLEEAKTERDFSGIIWMHERPYRIQALLECVHSLGLP